MPPSVTFLLTSGFQAILSAFHICASVARFLPSAEHTFSFLLCLHFSARNSITSFNQAQLPSLPSAILVFCGDCFSLGASLWIFGEAALSAECIGSGYLSSADTCY